LGRGGKDFGGLGGHRAAEFLVLPRASLRRGGIKKKRELPESARRSEAIVLGVFFPPGGEKEGGNRLAEPNDDRLIESSEKRKENHLGETDEGGEKEFES